ncbi:MAG: ABC transporter permease [Tannerella sp.]|jgi:putative ABC transport system permease protein|nr:ABC transporter permease [Tannerella sp.]
MKTSIRNFISVIRRFKMATVLNVLGLSVAFTAVIVIMMQVTYDFSFDRHHPDVDNIYRINTEFNGSRHLAIVGRPFLEGFKDYSPYVEAATISQPLGFLSNNIILAVERPDGKHYFEENGRQVTEDFYDIFHFDMVEGLAESIKEPNTVIIPKSTAQRMFGEASAVGEQLVSEKFTWIVGGVYNDFPKNSSTTNMIYVKIGDDVEKDNWSALNYEGYVRMTPSVNAQEVLDAYTGQLDPKLFEGLPGLTFSIMPIKEIHFATHLEFDSVEKASKQTVWVLIAIAFVILLIAAINFTNYSIALTPLRIKSINTQKVLGATEDKLRSTLVMEAVITCIVAWCIALLMTYLLSLTSITQIIHADMSLIRHVGLLAGIGLIALAVGLFAGIYPAFYMTSFAPALVLKGSFGLSPKGRQLRNGLVGVQFVASFALIVVALFMYLQINFMQRSSLGFDKEQIIITDLNSEIVKARGALANELKSNANIEMMSYTDVLMSVSDFYPTWARKFGDSPQFMFQVLSVDTGFLQVMGIPLLEGRDLRTSDESSEGAKWIFNEKAKKDFNLSAGVKGDFGDEIIGFIPDIQITSLRKDVEPMAIRLIREVDGTGRNYAYIRTKAGSNHAETMKYVCSTLERLSPGFPFNVRFYDEVINSSYQQENNMTMLITWFSLIAVLISMVGVFGLVVFESEFKRKEIGVRKVLGSSTGQILAMFNLRYVRILTICFVIAAPIAWYAISSWLENFAYRTPMYWWVFFLAFLLITAITMATVTFQSWRVADANPVDSLKTE